MYIPKHFAVTDRGVLHDVMRQFSFATLVTTYEGHPFATHLPVVLEPASGAHGTLITHMARANEQWRAFDGRSEALMIFQGHHGYISPSWYEAHPSVPTWNYVAVHAYGVPSLIEDEQRVRAALRGLVDQYEQGFDAPWSMQDLPDQYVRKMIRGIVAFEMPITRLEGKFKLSQNRSAADQQRVIEALGERNPLAQSMRLV